MNCSNSMAPTTEELIRVVLDGERLSKDAQAHLDACHVCQTRIAYLQQVEPFLVSRLYRSECPDVMQLHYYCLNQLPLDKAISTRRHIEYCPLCAHEVQDIMQVLDSFETPSTTLSSQVRSIIATLMPWQPQPVMRRDSASEISQESWPRHYRADSVNISLHLSRSSTGDLMLLGLFTSNNPDDNIEMFDGAPVDLYVTQESILTEDQLADPVMSSCVDDLGNVAFKAVSVGEYTMVVRLPSTNVVITELHIDQD